MNSIALVVIIIVYLSLLFYLTYYAEKNKGKRWLKHPVIYSLSLAVYTSAWTYYGSVGVAANKGPDFLPIYLGPVIAFPFWIVFMRKIYRISNHYNVSSIADFISLRYGKDRFIGALTTIILLIGIIPYIALQLKAISETFNILTNNTGKSSDIYNDATIYIAFILAVFAAFYGTRKIDVSHKHKGIIFSTAFESVIKLVVFLTIGIYVGWYLFDSPEQIYSQIKNSSGFGKLITVKGQGSSFNWFFGIGMSFFAIFLLPRQFHVSVVENTSEKNIKHAIWLFPLYLLLFNIFTIYIAWGGKLTLGAEVNADYYTLHMPLLKDNIFLALMVFIGGLSAIVSMVVISTLSLAIMVSNNLIIPYGFIEKFRNEFSDTNTAYIKKIRRVSIFVIIILSYIFYLNFSFDISLFSIGLVAFVIVSQLAPSFFIGLYWNRGSSKAAAIGMISGFLVSFYTLILPLITHNISDSYTFIENGLFGISYLRPYQLLGVDFLSPPAHAFFWSLSINTFSYLIFSLMFTSNYRERNYAELIVDNQYLNSLDDSGLIWKGEAYVKDIESLLERFLGEKKTKQELKFFFEKNDISEKTQIADARLINFSEKLLSNSIGGASAKILISGVVKEERISLREVLDILEETKTTIARNKKLQEKSKELTQLSKKLQELNDELVLKDRQKDDFLDTVAHELKTPLTGIRASAEILIDDEAEMESDDRLKFLNVIISDSDRLLRLIKNILDFEKFSVGKQKMVFEENEIKLTIKKAINSIKHLANSKKVWIKILNTENIVLRYDEDYIIQVITNLLSNALKFCDKINGSVSVDYRMSGTSLVVSVENNGKIIAPEDFNYIFDKFYQSQNQTTKKPIGSGIGLTICKNIVECHNGKIWAEKNRSDGARLSFTLPMNKKNKNEKEDFNS